MHAARIPEQNSAVVVRTEFCELNFVAKKLSPPNKAIELPLIEGKSIATD
jgi:hypothetical protein